MIFPVIQQKRNISVAMTSVSNVVNGHQQEVNTDKIRFPEQNVYAYYLANVALTVSARTFKRL